jgi:hypothetical protein
MLSFKQYLREAVTPEMRNRILANVNKSKSARSASNYNENPPLKALNRQAVPPEEGLPGRGYKGSRFQPDQPVRSIADRLSGKLNALISGRQADKAAADTLQAERDVRRIYNSKGTGILNKFLGSRVEVKDSKGKVVGSEVRGGFVDALKSYDQHRAKQGIAVNRRGTIDSNVLRNLGVRAAQNMSSSATASGPNLLRTLGASVRYARTGSKLANLKIGQATTGIESAGDRLANAAVSGTEHLTTTKIDGTPVSPEDKAAAITQVAQRNRLSQTGQAAQTVGMTTTPIQQSGETQDQLRARMMADRPAPLSTSTQARINMAKRTGQIPTNLDFDDF